jgi:RNA-directed DNA polymerase
MGRTVSFAPGYAPEDVEFDPQIDDFVSKERKYIHFDLPLSEARRAALSFNSHQIAIHSFWPLLAYESVERRAKKDKDGNTVFEEKVRPIKFASHADAALLEWYTEFLSEKYEAFLHDKTYRRSILAYRSDIDDNICHAKAVFEEISRLGQCTAIAVDISGFFDNIRHTTLSAALRSLLSVERLQIHDFKILQFMTKFTWVDSDALKMRLGKRYAKRGRICTASEFRQVVRSNPGSLLQKNKANCGIPQGTPLSGLYANISMMTVDQALFNFARSHNGSYRRYSDDIALVLPGDVDSVSVVSAISDILEAVGLALSVHKTEVSKFFNNGDEQISSRPFQYLGFTFNGKKTLIRQSSLNRYYSKMHKGIRAKIRAAKVKGVPRDEIYLRELYRKYTHFGKSRNFPRYAYRAARELNAPEIREQLRSHVKHFKAALRHYLDRAYRA